MEFLAFVTEFHAEAPDAKVPTAPPTRQPCPLCEHMSSGEVRAVGERQWHLVPDVAIAIMFDDATRSDGSATSPIGVPNPKVELKLGCKASGLRQPASLPWEGRLEDVHLLAVLVHGSVAEVLCHKRQCNCEAGGLMVPLAGSHYPR